MAVFKFDKTAISEILLEIRRARKFIKIAIFQLHNQKIFEELFKKCSEFVKVHIITLPYDSVKEDIRERVESSFRRLIDAGAKVDFIKWNVGDPERTTTAIGRWYSFHGKFIVTDKSAVALSANLIDKNELDAIIKFEDKDTISTFLSQFDYLIDVFVKDRGQNLRKLVDKEIGRKDQDLFNLPRVIRDNSHKDFWIKHYPISLCKEDEEIKNLLYITPFQFRARSLYEKIIREAESFVFISTESFTDQKFTEFLINLTLSKNISVKLLSGSKSMDFNDRLNNMLKELLANDIEVKTVGSLHSKLLITDKKLVVGSVNLNQMNLGFYKSKSFWRANTESLLVNDDEAILKKAKQDFESVFNKAEDVWDVLAKKKVNKIGSLLSKSFKLKSSKEAKFLFAKVIIHNEVYGEKSVYNLARITSKISELSENKIVSKEDFLRAVVLHYLSERKHDKNQISKKLSVIGSESSIETILSWLIEKNLIEEQEDFYKIKIEKLLG